MRSLRFEAKACYDARATSMAGGQSTVAALSPARLCYDTLLAEGEKARCAAQAGVVTDALERIVEANTYLSGIGLKAAASRGHMRFITASRFWKSATICTMAKSRVWYAGAAGVAEQPDGRDRNRAGVLSKVGLPVTGANGRERRH